jgi:hypothetical protein
MGYTHYWKYKAQQSDALKTKNILRDLLVLKKKLPESSTTGGAYFKEHDIVLRDGDGKGLAKINDELIRFNGDGNKGLDHETFIFEFNQLNIGFNFCKTARKPYDFFVCLTLITLANHLTGFSFSSDGNFEDWKPAFQFYNEIIGGEMSDNLKFVFLQNFNEDLVSQ